MATATNRAGSPGKKRPGTRPSSSTKRKENDKTLEEMSMLSGPAESACIKTLKEEVKCMCTLERRMVWCGAKDGSLVVHAPNGDVVKTIPPPAKDLFVWSLLAVDRERIWSGHSNGQIMVWSAETGSKVTVLDGHIGGVYCMIVEGDTVWSASADWTIRQWDAQTGSFRKLFAGHNNNVRCLTITGEQLWSGSDDCTIRVWNKETGEIIKEVAGISCSVTALTTAHNGLVWVGYDDRSIKVYNPASFKYLKELKGHSSRITCLTKVGQEVWSGSVDKTICVWDPETYELRSVLMGHTGYITSIVALGVKVWSCSSDKSTRVWLSDALIQSMQMEQEDLLAENRVLRTKRLSPEQEEELLALRAENERLKAHLTDLEGHVKALEAHVAALETEKADLIEERAFLRDKLNAAHSEVDLLHDQLKGVEEQMEALRHRANNETEESQAEIDSLMKDMEELHRKIKTLASHNTDLESKVHDLEEQLSVTAEGLEKSVHLCGQYEEDVQELRNQRTKEASDASEHISTLEKQLEMSLQGECDLKERVAGLEAELRTTREEGVRASGDAASIRENLEINLQDNKEDLERTRTDLARTREDLHSTQDKLAKSREDCEAVNGELRHTKDDLHYTRDQLDRRTGELDESHDTLQQTRSELDTTQRELDTTRRDLKNTRNALEQTKESLEVSGQGNEASLQRIRVLEDNLAKTREELDATQTRLSTTESELKTSQTALQQTKESLDASTHDNADLRGKIRTTCDDLSALQQESAQNADDARVSHEALKSELKTTQTALQQTVELLETSSQDNSELRDKIRHLEEDLAALHKQSTQNKEEAHADHETLQTELQTTQEVLQTREESLKETTHENVTLQERIRDLEDTLHTTQEEKVATCKEVEVRDTRLCELEEDLLHARQEITASQDRERNLESRTESLLADVTSSNADKTALSQHIRDVEGELEELRNEGMRQQEETATRQAQLEATIATAREEKEKCEDEIAQLTETLQRTRMEAEDEGALLRSKAEAFEEALHETEDHTNKALLEKDETIEHLEGRIRELEDEIAVLKKRMAELDVLLKEYLAHKQREMELEGQLTDEERIELISLVNFLNATLREDPHVRPLLPIDPHSMSIFRYLPDGVILCKLVNKALPGTVDERVLNMRDEKNELEIEENLNLFLNAAKVIGVDVRRVTPEQMRNFRPRQWLQILWDVVKNVVFNTITVQKTPELAHLVADDEEPTILTKLAPPQLLMRWFNYHLAKGLQPRRLTNFTSDLKDSEKYIVLQNRLAPGMCSLSILKDEDWKKRADEVLENARILGVSSFLSHENIIQGNENLNMAFAGMLFNARHGLPPVEELDPRLRDLEGNAQETREERSFRTWVNSLGIDYFVTNLMEDLRDGIVLLQIIDVVVGPNYVEWNRVNKSAKSVYKRVENCNYVVELAKTFLRNPLVGISGKDIAEGTRKLTLALVYQLMRFDVLKFLHDLRGDVGVTDLDVVKWANEKVQSGGKATRMESFRDGSLSNSMFLIDLLASVEPRAINYNLVTPGRTDNEAQQNAKYVISSAWKIGCQCFLVWEDIVEVKSKMIMVFVGSVMLFDNERNKATQGTMVHLPKRRSSSEVGLYASRPRGFTAV